MHKGLDSFRALAFLGVFWFHARIFLAGYLGVQAFFVLSGFLLIPILVDMKERLSTKSYFTSFYGRRALRIFPLYYAFLSVMFLICVISLRNYGWIRDIRTFVEQAPWAFTYTYDFFHASPIYGTPNLLLTHFWSLAVEEQFYLLCPIVILLTQPKRLKHLLLVTIAFGPIFRWLLALAVHSGRFPFLDAMTDRVIYVLPFSHLDAFAMGGYFALYQKGDKTGLPAFLLLCSSVPVGYLTQYLATGHVALNSFGYAEFMRDQYVWGYSLFNYIFARIITQIRTGNFFQSFFNNHFMIYAGKISYGLYVFHLPVLWLMKYIIPAWSNTGMAAVALVITVCVSVASYELFEKRFIHMKDRLFPVR